MYIRVGKFEFAIKMSVTFQVKDIQKTTRQTNVYLLH